MQGNGRWVAWDDIETLKKTYWEFLDFIAKEFAGKVQHVVIRTCVSIVSVSPACFVALMIVDGDMSRR